MNLSGIVVSTSPNKFLKCQSALNAIENIEVHHADEESSRFVVVQEAESVRQEINGLKRIKKLPMVTYAEMVYHYIAEDDLDDETPPEDLALQNLNSTLARLNNDANTTA